MGTVQGRLQERIRQRGPLPFADFMEESLYGPGGYYTRDEVPIGESGDYATGSSLSPLFGRLTARLLRRLDQLLGRPADYLEAGYGGAAHLRALVDALGDLPERRLWAQDRFPRPVPAGVARLESLDGLGEGQLWGLIFSYELFDALPVHRLIQAGGGQLQELWVDVDAEGRFRWRQGELSDPTLGGWLERAGVVLREGQLVDFSPGWGPLYRRLVRRLGRGLVVTCDYGFETERLVDPRIRFHGTLACYRRHRVHRNPFVAVGEQDLTAHVDFSLLRQMGEEEGLETLAWTRQAAWLTACGIFDELRGNDPDLRRQAMALLDAEGMGEEIRVLVQGKGVQADSLFDTTVLA